MPIACHSLSCQDPLRWRASRRNRSEADSRSSGRVPAMTSRPFPRHRGRRLFGFEALEERVRGDSSGVLVEQSPELGGNLAEDGHAVVVRVLLEEDRARVHDVGVVLDQTLLAQVRLVDLALGSVLVDEPVVTQRVRVSLSRQPHDLGCLYLESFKLTW